MKYWLIKNTCEGSFVFTKPPITLSTPLVLLCMCTSKVDSSIIEERKSIGKKKELMQKTLLAFFRDYWSSGRRSEWHFIRWRAVICQTLSCCSARTNRQVGGREASTEHCVLFVQRGNSTMADQYSLYYLVGLKKLQSLWTCQIQRGKRTSIEQGS